jgi:hypothetical protein
MSDEEINQEFEENATHLSAGGLGVEMTTDDFLVLYVLAKGYFEDIIKDVSTHRFDSESVSRTRGALRRAETCLNRNQALKLQLQGWDLSDHLL